MQSAVELRLDERDFPMVGYYLVCGSLKDPYLIRYLTEGKSDRVASFHVSYEGRSDITQVARPHFPFFTLQSISPLHHNHSDKLAYNITSMALRLLPRPS